MVDVSDVAAMRELRVSLFWNFHADHIIGQAARGFFDLHGADIFQLARKGVALMKQPIPCRLLTVAQFFHAWQERLPQRWQFLGHIVLFRLDAEKTGSE